MNLIRDLAGILADTGPFCRAAEAGEQHLEMTASYLKPNVQVVEDVRKELRRRSETRDHARLKRLALLHVPEGDAITITDSEVLAEIRTILERRRKLKPAHADADKGEVSTALAAQALSLPVLMDDGFGKNLAMRRGVRVFTTQDLAIEMAAVGHLKSIFAFGIYRVVYLDSTRAEFDLRVAALKAKLTGRA